MLVNPFTGQTLNAFCPTGEGGGVDPTCGGKSTSGGGGSKRKKLGTKPPSGMSGSAINKELDQLDALDSSFTDEMIESGRGSEKFSEWTVKTDELSKWGLAISKRRSQLRTEVELRYGPGAPSRLPKGFGPIKKIY